MFNSTFKNIAQSAFLATLVATAMSAVPAAAGDGGGNMDRYIKYYAKHADAQEGAEDQSSTQNNTQYTNEPFTHTGLLPDDADEPYGVSASYRVAPKWSVGLDR